MKIIIDTSSWVALVRYYLPFDNANIISTLIEEKVNNEEIIILSEVYSECKYQSKGIVIQELPFVLNKSYHTKTNELFPTKSFYNSLENQFCNQAQKRMLDDVEFENRKQSFLSSADAKIILQAINYTKIDKEDVLIVTEETPSNNDLKVFKKIPTISGYLGIKCITVPQLITFYGDEIGLEIDDKKKPTQTSLF